MLFRSDGNSPHDRSLGRVGNYHLFRLPPALEDRLQQAIEAVDSITSAKQIESPDTAMETLKQLADAVVKAPEGPCRSVSNVAC